MKTLRVLYITSDLAPLTGSGHLAKEVQFLSRAMADLGMSVSVAVPGYRAPTPTAFGLARRLTPLLVDTAHVPFESTVHEGNLAGGRVKVFVLDVPGAEEADIEAQRDAFCRAALTLAVQEELRPDVVCAGPGTEPALALARASAGPDGTRPVTIYALRDLDAQGPVAEALPHADHVVVSSPTLAATLRALPESDALGRLLAPVRNGIHGIVPGVDFVTWNPRHDGLPASDIRAAKVQARRQIKQRLGLRGSARSPLVALAGPFDDQVLTEPAARSLFESDALVVVLAEAERDRAACRRFEQMLRPGRGALHVTRGEQEIQTFERALLCAADFAVFARPFSLTAPSELYCMHYGVVPIAPRLAGYSDILAEFDIRTATGSGFLFDPAVDGHLGAAMARALRAHRQSESFAVLVERMAHFDLSWRTTARRYADLLRPVPVEPAQPRHDEQDAEASAAPAAL